ncbi:MAG TPA: 2-succinyl-5-enolpyruvyl-6-hydroxy-3-cyclohexene-1-carboxylic-acid synthase [Candidatus Limnocylindria bacterium]|nr:2-succinyl-5-enolpyruvyl-6-hydroxy-3-cyclohexene-1-carboxylic-acid synthase [Candidatus Limnocylindria bacterium]
MATARAVAALIGALAAGGVRDACLAPGSRSAPLAIALERHPAIRVWPHLDERSAAFFGLGLARATRAPVVLLATSGTAAANFLPAVVEARQARVPLVVITADRPPELRDAGAPQTIDQQGLYGTYVKWTHELAIVDDDAEGEGYVRSVALRAIADATSAPAGPVHLNVPLREPLVPDPDTLPPVRVFGEVRLRAAPRPPDEDAVAALAADCAHAERGLIVCGPQDDPRLPATLVRLARITGFPVIADPLSLARFGPHDRSLVIDRYDALLRAEAIASAFAPDIVLRIGDTPTSKPLLDYLARHARARQVLIPGDARWNDPTFVARDLVSGDLRLSCDALAAALGARSGVASEWSERWRDADRRAGDALDAWLDGLDEPFEGRAIAQLAARIPDGATLVAGNSMPVRDLDAFARGSARALRVLGNRGASGIDGVLSTALGISAGSAGPVALAIGDVSFVHDLGGLVAARAHGLRATILLVNNDGGGIFSFLPVARHRAQFERLFSTPHGLDLSHVRDLFGVGFARARDAHELPELLDAAFAADGVSIVEVRTERERNVALHRAAWEAVARAAESVLA